VVHRTVVGLVDLTVWFRTRLFFYKICNLNLHHTCSYKKMNINVGLFVIW
jgi:hypothetical protein